MTVAELYSCVTDRRTGWGLFCCARFSTGRASRCNDLRQFLLGRSEMGDRAFLSARSAK